MTRQDNDEKRKEIKLNEFICVLKSPKKKNDEKYRDKDVVLDESIN